MDLLHVLVEKPGATLEYDVLNEVYERGGHEGAGEDRGQIGVNAESLIDEVEFQAHEVIEHDGLQRDLPQELQNRIIELEAGEQDQNEEKEYDFKNGLHPKTGEFIKDRMLRILIFCPVDRFLDESSVDEVQDHEENGRGDEKGCKSTANDLVYAFFLIGIKHA